MSTAAPTETGTEGNKAPTEATKPPAGTEQAGKSFTQADVDRIVQDRLSQQAKNKFGDYDELKTKADGATTLEQRLGALETELSTTKSEALRATIAARFGVSTEKGPKGEPSDADLFLTGSDESTLTAQAQRLAAREEDRKKQGNFAPKEGQSPSSSGGSDDLRDFTKKLFNKE